MKFLKLDKLSFRNRLIIMIAGGVIVFLIVVLVSGYPVIREMDKLAKETLVYEGRIKEAQRLIAIKNQIVNEYKSYETALNKPPSDAEAINIIKEEVDNMAKDAGMTCDSPVHKDPRKPSEFWREYIVEVAKIESKTENVIRFIGKVQSSESIYRIEKLNLMADKASDLVKGSILVSKIMMAPDEAPKAAAQKESEVKKENESKEPPKKK